MDSRYVSNELVRNITKEVMDKLTLENQRKFELKHTLELEREKNSVYNKVIASIKNNINYYGERTMNAMKDPISTITIISVSCMLTITIIVQTRSR